MITGQLPNAYSSFQVRPPAYSQPPNPGAAMSMASIEQSLMGKVLNTSRTPLDAAYLTGLPEGSPALPLQGKLPHTGQPQVDRVLGKLLQGGAYSLQGATTLAMDAGRGLLLGGMGGGFLGLAGGGAAKALNRSWPAKVTLPVGLLLGGSLGAAGAGTVAFARSAVALARNVKLSLNEQYQELKASLNQEWS